MTWHTATVPSAVTEDADRVINLTADANWAREACAFIIFMHNMVRSFVASELMLLACMATLRYDCLTSQNIFNYLYFFNFTANSN